jgi:alcohol dehydrogenase
LEIRAAILPATGAALEIAEVELAPPGPGEVLVRLAATGVCHSDQNAIDGTAPTRCPAVLGHEGAGTVVETGSGTTLVAVGDRVALSWAPYCGACEQCLRELPQLCEAAWPAMEAGGLLDGSSRLSRDGGPVYHYSLLSTFAELAVVPERACVPIAADVPFEIAGLVGCAITTGVCAVWRTAGVRPGDRVAVVGCGGVGLSAVMGAAAAGADRIVAVDLSPEKAAAAEGFGATDAVVWQGSAEDTGGAVRELTGGGVDHAFEATGRPEAMLAAFTARRY